MMPSDKEVNKYTVQCIRSDKINGNFGKFTKEKTLCRYDRPLQHVGKIGKNYHTVKAVVTKPTISEVLYNSQ